MLVEAAGAEAVDFVVEAVTERFHPEDVVVLDDGESACILLNGSVNDTLYLTDFSYSDTFKEGFTERNEIVSSQIMYVSWGWTRRRWRPSSPWAWRSCPGPSATTATTTPATPRRWWRANERYGITPTYIIAGGKAVIGYDDGGEFALDYIRDNGITIGLIETNVQRENIMQSGVEDAAVATDYNTVRVFSVWDYIQYRYGYYGYEGAEEVENTLYRAIVERNVRVIYFKPVKQTDNSFAYITDVDVYRDMFEGLNQRLAAHGISMGRASVMDNFQIPSLVMLVLGLGAGVGGALLPATFLPMKRRWTLILAGNRRGVCGGGLGGAAQHLPPAGQLCQRRGVCLPCRRLLPPERQAPGTAAPLQRQNSDHPALDGGDPGPVRAHRPGRRHDDRRAPLLH